MKKLNSEERLKRIDELKESLGRGELTLGQSVKAMRHSAGLSQKDLAKALKMNLVALSELERDLSNPTIKTLNKIGVLFGAEVAFRPKIKKNQH